MYHFNRLFVELLKRDRRYKAEAYAFVFEALDYAQNVLQLGKDEMNEPISEELAAEAEEFQAIREQDESDHDPKCHISGPELCLAAKEYAVLQYGFMAKTVLESIGIRRTDDIGNIVFNLIGIGQMRKTPSDHHEDFVNVFDFASAFGEDYQIR